MKVTLKNGCLCAVLDTKGAEINSFVNEKTNTHYIWDGDVSVWKYHAPVLFPHTGRIKDGYMTYQGKKYSLLVNGFSRDMEHELASSSKKTADFVLKSNDETKQKYPFDFELRTHYEITDCGMIFTTTVKNTDTKDISFSLGSHSAFCCPHSEKGETIGDWQIEFQNKKPLVQVLCTKDGYLDCENTQEIRTAPYNEKTSGVIPLDEKGFGNGHFFCDIESDWVGLFNKKDKSILKVNTKGYPYLMVWQNQGEPRFVCIEPWHGTPDCNMTHHKWEDKKALVTLATQKEFTCDQSFWIE